MCRSHPTLSFLWLVFALVLTSAAPVNAALEGPAPPNPRLENSASPYLQSHSRDRVRWYQWGQDAFARAKELNLPLLVSFGYRACHWCHVMQEQHFNNEEIASLINSRFVPVVVDRERRTTLDETYMLVTELLTQRGGWPNTVFLTPELKPFYGTAYIPPEDFSGLVSAISSEWDINRQPILLESERLSSIITGFLTRTEAALAVTPQALAGSAKQLVAQFDSFSGGMGDAPKFFRPTVLSFLLQKYARDGDTDALDAVERTLGAVQSGGIHDHIEGGFHRYAIDPGWRVPHFEKMLYDQAQLAALYVEVFRLTGNPAYASTARKTLDYILADLTAAHGGFYSTRDADSEGEEGTYYVWTPEQLSAALGDGDAQFALNMFGLIADGDFAGKVILNLDAVQNQSVPKLTEIFAKLGKTRRFRQKPVRDDKVLISWNGLTISAFAQAAVILSEPAYLSAAERAASFIWRQMRSEDGKLLRSHFEGKASVDGELDDYALLTRAFLDLYDATGDGDWLGRARALAQILRDEFRDPEAGDFYATRTAFGFGRTKPRSDVDQPSGNGAALDALARLYRRTGDPSLKRDVDQVLSALSGLALGSPAGGASALAAADRFKRGETGPIQFAGNGNVRIEMKLSSDRKVARAELTMAPGWHVNAHNPLEDHFIPTRLQLATVEESG